MYKSQFSQAFLVSCLGPFGLIYSNFAAGILATLLTLLVTILYPSRVLYILAVAVLISFAAGKLLVARYNAQRLERLQNPGYFDGNIHCRRTGKPLPQTARYHLLLRRLRMRRKVLMLCKFVITPLTMVALYWYLQPPDDKRWLLVLAQELIAPVQQDTVANNLLPAMAAALPTSVASEGATTWRGVTSADASLVAYSLQAQEFNRAHNGWVRPELHVSCHRGQLEVSVQLYEILGTNAQISIQERFDRVESREQPWRLEADYQTLVSLSPNLLLRKISNQREFQIEYLPFGASTRTATFNFPADGDAMAEVRSNCSYH